MSQFTENQHIDKESSKRPTTRGYNQRKPPLAYSSNNISIRNRRQQPSADQVLLRELTRKTAAENSSGQYLHFKLLRRHINTPIAEKFQQNFQEELPFENGFTKNRKMRGVSLGKVNAPLTMQRDRIRPGTTQNIGDKWAYFDEFLSDVEVLRGFKMMSHIGKGAFSTVSLAIGKDNKKNFAIKAYEKIDALDWNRLACIKREVRHLKTLDSERVVKLYDLVRERKKLYLIMENAGKQSLAGILRKERTLPQNVARRYFAEILQGICYCHQQGVCHRDLKPENILIDDFGKIKLIDFGFSASSRGLLNNFCGTPAYMSPEIVKKMPYNGGKADIWALGILLYLVLVGVFPFRAGNEQQLYRLISNGKYRYRQQGAVSQSGKKLISRMLQIKPQLRPSASQLLKQSWINI